MHRRLASPALAVLETDCATCPSGGRCWGELPLPIEGLRGRRAAVLERGEWLVRQGERAGAVYLVVNGCLLLRDSLIDGTHRVVGLSLPGELLGLQAYARGIHAFTAEAATTTSVCRLSLPAPGHGTAESALLQRLLLKHALQSERAAAPWAGLPALERVAAFIENFAQRARVRRGPDALFSLPMTRADIGSYLGLAPETVVRALRQLCNERRMSVHGRTICLRDRPPASASPAA